MELGKSDGIQIVKIVKFIVRAPLASICFLGITKKLICE